MPQVTLVFADGERARFPQEEGQPIMAAAKAAGIKLASDCEMGDCQTCKAHINSGKVEIDELAFVTLEDDEIANGAVLTCVSSATEDVEIALPYVRSHLLPDKQYVMKISEITPASPTTACLRGVLPANSAFKFHPGQYVNIKVPGTGELRSYSMANAPAPSNELEFHIRVLPEGVMSNFVKKPHIVGETVEIAGPKGVFYLREDNRPILMVAGGTGLAPMMSMLRSLVTSASESRPITLCFGVNNPSDLYGLGALDELARRLPKFELRLAMVEPGREWSGHKGFVTDLIKLDDLEADARAYLCGPPVMIEAARKRLTDFGLAGNAIFAEEFVPSNSATP